MSVKHLIVYTFILTFVTVILFLMWYGKKDSFYFMAGTVASIIVISVIVRLVILMDRKNNS